MSQDLDNQTGNIEAIKKQFYSYGFDNCPLADVDIEFLIEKGVDEDDIFDIGCDINANQFTTVEEAAEWYQKRNQAIFGHR